MGFVTPVSEITIAQIAVGVMGTLATRVFFSFFHSGEGRTC